MHKALVTSRDYYHLHITNIHETGDIWINLPTFGLLNIDLCSGLVITPACDLSNRKVETITYLPIISIKEWLNSRCYYPFIRETFINYINNLEIKNGDELLSKNQLPTDDELKLCEFILDDCISELNIVENQKKILGKRELINKCKIAINILKNLSKSENIMNLSDLQYLIGVKNYKSLIKSLIRNNQSNDLHFLPADRENYLWSGIKQHSLVLFRYPITAPIEIFDLAMDTGIINWSENISTLKDILPCSKNFIKKRPVKVSKLKKDFLSDLLTRYISLYVRIGSSDFDNEIINNFVNEI